MNHRHSLRKKVEDLKISQRDIDNILIKCKHVQPQIK